MEWPSQRVPQGGIFQPGKVKFSPETRDFLKVLIDESKLTMMQRKQVNYSLRSGDPLPHFDPSNSMQTTRKPPKVVVRPGTSKRRSQNTIVSSGAYERDRFVPQNPKVDREKSKRHLQDHMAYGKDVGPTPRRPKPRWKKEESDSLQENRFDQLLREIEERRKFLKDMERLGEGSKYKTVIEQQIQAKLREMKTLKTPLEATRDFRNPFYKDNLHLAAVILARGGSKSIPLKNLVKVGGITILKGTLNAILNTKGFTTVWVSTDHDEIYNEALVTEGKVNIHWRSQESATDNASSVFAVQEFLNWHPEVDIVGLIQCTSPFIKSQFLQKAVRAIRFSECAFSATRSYKLRWAKIGHEIVPLNFNPKRRPRRQDFNSEFIENGMFYFSPRNYIERGHLQSNR